MQERPFTFIRLLYAQFKHLSCNILHGRKYALMIKMQNCSSPYNDRCNFLHRTFLQIPCVIVSNRFNQRNTPFPENRGTNLFHSAYEPIRA